MITNRYYITTIIAIFLSLSLGILIGGTLGQQWINVNQQKIISHYEAKAEELTNKNEMLKQNKEEINQFYLKLKNDYRELFTNSVTNAIEGKKILWINDSNHSFGPLRKTIELAGGTISDFQYEANAVYQDPLPDQMNLYDYDVILFFPSDKEKLPDYKWLLKYGKPVIYITDSKATTMANQKIEIDMYEQKVNVESLNEHFQFVHFLKNLLMENEK